MLLLSLLREGFAKIAALIRSPDSSASMAAANLLDFRLLSPVSTNGNQ
jgi:hypothetical protein